MLSMTSYIIKNWFFTKPFSTVVELQTLWEGQNDPPAFSGLIWYDVNQLILMSFFI